MPRFSPGVTVISGPSGVGKHTITVQLFKRFPELHLGTSLTTRAKRPNDVEGQYEHVSKDEFLRRDADGHLLEWVEYASNYYGTLMPDKNDTSLLLEIEYQGAAQVRHHVPGARLIFIKPPGETIDDQIKVLEERLAGRATDSETARLERLITARRELELGPVQSDLVVVNDDLDTAVDEIADQMFYYLKQS